MTAETLPYPNAGTVENGDVKSNPNVAKKSRESERRRRRRKQKKNKNSNKASDASGDESDDESKENSVPVLEQVEIEYVPEKAELDGIGDEEFRRIFEKFTFTEAAASEETEKKDESTANAASAKKDDFDSDEEEQEVQEKEKGTSNKKKKLQRRMKIAELKQICSRPDVVEVWDATSSDPKLLVFLKSYRNSVPVPRHWCQKRKFLQGSG